MINGFSPKVKSTLIQSYCTFFLLIFQLKKKKWINEVGLDQFQVPGNKMNCHIPFQHAFYICVKRPNQWRQIFFKKNTPS